MAQKRSTDQTKLIAEAALALAGQQGWDALTLKDIARKAKIPLKTVEARFSDVWDILKWVLKKLEKDTQDAVKGYLGEDWRDNLMEILMMRFELAQKHREAFAAIPAAALRHPPVVRRFARSFYRTMERMMELAGAPEKQRNPLFVAGFGAVYVSLVDVWAKDETPDLSKTMAAIDKRIGHYQAALEYLRCRRA